MRFNISLNTDDSRNGFLEINSYTNNEKYYFYVTGKNLWLFLMDLIIHKAQQEYNATPTELNQESWINQNRKFHFAYWKIFRDSRNLLVEYRGSEIIAHWQLIQIKYRSELEQIQKELESCFQYSKDSDCKELIYNALDALHTDLFN